MAIIEWTHPCAESVVATNFRRRKPRNRVGRQQRRGRYGVCGRLMRHGGLHRPRFFGKEQKHDRSQADCAQHPEDIDIRVRCDVSPASTAGFGAALDHLDHPNCQTGCYRCLESYSNQRHHEFLQWPVTIPHLRALADERPAPKPLERGDDDSPRPWLESHAVGVGSPLELKFLRLFEKYGFTPEKQVLVAPADGCAPISIADFAVPGQRLAIYIDGAAFHVGANLRRDRYIRDRLRNGTPPWRVEELSAADLALGERLVRRLIGN